MNFYKIQKKQAKEPAEACAAFWEALEGVKPMAEDKRQHSASVVYHCKRCLAFGISDIECKADCSPNLNQLCRRQVRDQCPYFPFRNSLQVVTIDSAVARHAVCF
jgi:hypothetical protein